MPRWRQRLVSYFVMVYLLLQVAFPAWALQYAHEEEQSPPFSWQMFARVFEDRGE